MSTENACCCRKLGHVNDGIAHGELRNVYHVLKLHPGQVANLEDTRTRRETACFPSTCGPPPPPLLVLVGTEMRNHTPALPNGAEITQKPRKSPHVEGSLVIPPHVFRITPSYTFPIGFS